MVEDLGHHVTPAGSAREALDVLRAGTPVDFVMTDHPMPATTGLELAAAVAMLRPRLPVLLASGYADVSEAAVAHLARLPKPFTQAALARAIVETACLGDARVENGGTVVRLPRRGAQS